MGDGTPYPPSKHYRTHQSEEDHMASAGTKIMEKTARWVAKQAQKRAPVGGDNRFLEGAYAPVASEITSTKLKVTGNIPKELDGILARIGPNPIHAPNPATYHWFVGDGMVHGLRLLNGEALWYRNRWVGTDKANRELKRPLVPGNRHGIVETVNTNICLLYTSPSPRDRTRSRMPSSA